MINELRRIVSAVSAAPDIKTTFRLIVSEVKTAMSTEVCSLYLLDENNHRYIFTATEGLNQGLEGKISLNISEGLIGLIARTAQPLNVADTARHPNNKLLNNIGEEPFHAFLGCPIIHQRKILGVLVIQQRSIRQFNTAEEAFLITIAAQLAGVVAHAQVLGALQTSLHNPQKKNIKLKGLAASAGIAIGKAHIINSEFDILSVTDRHCDDIDAEIALFSESLLATQNHILDLKQHFSNRLGKQEILLFDVFIQMLDENNLGGETIELIKQGYAAATALSKVIRKHIQLFETMNDPYLRERADDIKDLGQRVYLFLLKESPIAINHQEPYIAIGENLSTTSLGEIVKDNLVGLASIDGSQNAHLAILARAMGIPTVMGINDLPLKEIHHQKIIVDGYQGEIIINPADSIIQKYEDFQQESLLIDKGLTQLKTLPAKTLDDHSIKLFINTGLMVNVDSSVQQDADGVGLFRTEIEFLLGETFPSEKEQIITYGNHLKTFHPKPVIMRCLDIGGDKPLPYFPINETNPYLGWRGIRVTLDHPDIFLAQVKAMLKANKSLGNLKILLPMISQINEFVSAKAIILDAFNELKMHDPQLPLPDIGMMIEVPSVIYQLQAFTQHADFFSVGSNDLCQYLLAVDRNNPNVSSLYDHFHPAVLKACYEIAQICQQANKPVSICGELAGEPAAAPLLLAMGFDSLSLSSRHLLRVKSIIRLSSLTKAQHLLKTVLTLNEAAEVKAYLSCQLAQDSIVPLFNLNSTSSK